MAKKTKTRRSGRPRLSEAQLQAYRQRRAMLEAAQAETPTPSGSEPARVAETHWGRLPDEYAMIRSDLIRLLIISALMVVILVALTFVLN
ncbi:hypothetical protein [Sphaerobacter thermophilus]|uniref:Uncharacterized protein n=1 Tax=Sphaerobacter thermophilus (strain ATCC 49802 / DSM 20745 / KCCM 41009 / NCIMB 13125 / S 6022) TaxID=479434 RepID=D1C2I7_SPHTD|nr:hypothetical protein [Sphaerobacter thermophilus]ACZ38454.1 hypothetical protein Sthe_1018 [Sphaerobacter thermophilus DSM 20745]PZN68251.1 MAG: hypothetical protein DIU58_00755 [Sphaerobacter thermophilus]